MKEEFENNLEQARADEASALEAFNLLMEGSYSFYQKHIYIN